MKQIELSWMDVEKRAEQVAMNLTRRHHHATISCYPVPRGGVYAALLIQAACSRLDGPVLYFHDDSKSASTVVDDIIDSGRTREKYKGKDFVALVDKRGELQDYWVKFPWETSADERGPEDNIRRMLQYIGEDPDREGLVDTPKRVVRSYSELFSGYGKDPKDVMKVFEDGACDEVVIVRDAEIYSTCEHHMLPFFGRAHVAYVPNGKVLGVSKIVRLLEIFARRLQIQERLCQQVTSALDEHLQPRGSACVIEAQHFCMTCRGVQKQNSVMITSSLTGVFRDKGEARNEFLTMIKR